MVGRFTRICLLVALILPLSGCGAAIVIGASGASPDGGVEAPPVGAGMDYQLGAAYEAPGDAEIVVRDRTAAPAERRYGVCYVNAFQTQPGEAGDWPRELLLRDDEGANVIDPDWPDEVLIDTRPGADQDALVSRVGGWIDECARAGFDAVEFDNLDTYARTGGVLHREDAVSIARRLVERAHAAGLAAAQKNAAEDARLFHDEAGFDFAVVEECAQFDECGVYRDAYGDAVIGVEYTDAQEVPFDHVCASADRPASLVLRDRDLVAPSDAAYVREECPTS